MKDIKTQRDEYLANVPELYRETLKKAFKGKSRKFAMIGKCLDCTNNQRNEIKHCLIPTCPLHEVRPYQSKDEIEPETPTSESV